MKFKKGDIVDCFFNDRVIKRCEIAKIDLKDVNRPYYVVFIENGGRWYTKASENELTLRITK